MPEAGCALVSIYTTSSNATAGAAGQWRTGDPHILVVADAGYDTPRLAYLLRDLPVQVLGRMRSDRVLRRAAPPRRPGTNGRPPRHGGEFIFGDPASWARPR
nr:transposase [Micromonospora sp. HNM0581]